MHPYLPINNDYSQALTSTQLKSNIRRDKNESPKQYVDDYILHAHPLAHPTISIENIMSIT